MSFAVHPLDANLSASAERYPTKPAVCIEDRVLTYKELDQLATAVAAFLQSKLSIARGEAVLLILENDLEFIVSYYAVLRAGGVVVPINPRKAAREVQQILADAKPGLAVTYGEQASVLLAGPVECLRGGLIVGAPEKKRLDVGLAGQRWKSFEQATECGEMVAKRGGQGDDLALIVYTSGTTGDPKGCAHLHVGVQRAIASTRKASAITSDDVALVSLPLYHVTGMQSSMNVPIAAGAALVLAGHWNAEIAAKLIERHKVTCWRNVATMMKDFVEATSIARYDLSSLKFLGGGGAPMSVSLHERVHAVTGLHYVEGFGMTETMAATHMNPRAAPKPGSIGLPLEGVEASIVSLDTGEPCETGVDGELVIVSPQLFSGYFGRPAETEATYMHRNGKKLFMTGDIGHVDADGFFYITDRRKRMINVSGFKVWPAEIEKVLMSHADVADAGVIGIEDERRGQSVKALVVLKPGRPEEDASAKLTAWCQENLSSYKVPRIFEYRKSLPRTSTGKLEWKALR
ncbi:long-chain-fatty-acid--CoA ligase (plasmid) [Mesorhizobium sp. 131-2-5]|uniref:AMP-binding protein n=1 Tax=Mesorhizobium sp. 131-2-5 TaxID=2744519 RepID=UPI0018EA8AA4|nr:AMP-binding protein [Mesorhizobium sp. 131-2-5]BCH05647.1 long-chain-fatty-acid--CoA ligase [Mesorhizobium sp. 131-2-5]